MAPFQQPPSAPTIPLYHIRLRPFSDQDAANLQALLSDPDHLAAFGHEVAPTLEEVVELILPKMFTGYTSHGGQMSHVNIAIADSETHSLTGLVGLDIVGDGSDVRTSLLPGARGQGHGKRALTAVLEWVRDSTEINSVAGATKPDNVAAAAIMAGAGMVETHEDAGDEGGGIVPARTFVWNRPNPTPADAEGAAKK